MNSQPNRTEQPPEATPRDNETEPRGIIDSIPATAGLDQKASSQPNDQRPDFHSLNSMIGVPMEIGRFLPLAVAITGAVKEVHRGGLIHKDIKPDNILVTETGEVQLRGFDIASRLPRERQLPAPPEFLAGTLAYIAPEQTGRMNHSIDTRTLLNRKAREWVSPSVARSLSPMTVGYGRRQILAAVLRSALNYLSTNPTLCYEGRGG